MNPFTTITCIVPRLPPAVNGLGDYGLNLARQLRQDYGLKTNFIVGNPSEAQSREVFYNVCTIEGFGVKQVAERSPTALLELLPSDSGNREGEDGESSNLLNSKSLVLLHYVGYGYAKRGCPVWLVEGLERWRKVGQTLLVTMFHEIYAYNAPIWTTQFLTLPLQKNLATRLARLSDRCITSKQGYAEIIDRLSQGKHPHIPALPVFSTVGEPEHILPLVERPRRLVVFGGPGWRSRVYQKSRLALQRTCRDLEIEEIVDIGPPLAYEIQPVNGTLVISMGVKPAEEISYLLSNSVAGFFDYPTEYLAKSTIFAAYCAHKLLPVGVFNEGQNVDGLQAGKHYWLGDRHQGSISLSDGQIVADNAYDWYQLHRLSVQASIFATWLMGNQ